LPEKPQITVIVSADGSAERLEATLRGLAAGFQVPAQALVLAWTPQDAAAATARGVAVLELPATVGPSAARNQVVGVLDSPWLAFLQAGLRVDPGWDGKALELLRADSGLAAVGGRLMDEAGNLQHAGYQGMTLRADERPLGARYQGEAPAGAAMRPRRYQSLSEHCLILSREDFLAVGGFDVALTSDYAGHDLCFKLRFQRNKALAYQPACVAHWTAGSCPPPGAPVRMVEHKIFYERWKDRYFPDYAIWDAVDASEAKTGRWVPDYERLL
jgi:GT2 family glycosyltransferase